MASGYSELSDDSPAPLRGVLATGLVLGDVADLLIALQDADTRADYGSELPLVVTPRRRAGLSGVKV